MRKQLLVSLLCCLLVSAASLAQSWKPYEQAAKGKTYEASDCVTLLDSTSVSVQPRTRVVCCMQSDKGTDSEGSSG